MESWNLSTLEVDAVREFVQDALLADDMRRIREFREPGCFPAYGARLIRNRAACVASRRDGAVALDEAAEGSCRPSDLRAPVAGRAEPVTVGAALLRVRHVLSATQFRVLWLRHVEGLSTGQPQVP
jgi:hypothetical protein